MVNTSNLRGGGGRGGGGDGASAAGSDRGIPASAAGGAEGPLRGVVRRHGSVGPRALRLLVVAPQSLSRVVLERQLLLLKLLSPDSGLLQKLAKLLVHGLLDGLVLVVEVDELAVERCDGTSMLLVLEADGGGLTLEKACWPSGQRRGRGGGGGCGVGGGQGREEPAVLHAAVQLRARRPDRCLGRRVLRLQVSLERRDPRSLGDDPLLSNLDPASVRFDDLVFTLALVEHRLSVDRLLSVHVRLV